MFGPRTSTAKWVAARLLFESAGSARRPGPQGRQRRLLRGHRVRGVRCKLGGRRRRLRALRRAAPGQAEGPRGRLRVAERHRPHEDLPHPRVRRARGRSPRDTVRADHRGAPPARSERRRPRPASWPRRSPGFLRTSEAEYLRVAPAAAPSGAAVRSRADARRTMTGALARWASLGLRTKFALLIELAMLALGAATGVSPPFARGPRSRPAQQRGLAIAADLATFSVRPLLANDLATLRRFVNHTMSQDYVRSVAVLDPDGTVVMHSDLVQLGRRAADPLSRAAVAVDRARLPRSRAPPRRASRCSTSIPRSQPRARGWARSCSATRGPRGNRDRPRARRQIALVGAARRGLRRRSSPFCCPRTSPSHHADRGGHADAVGRAR